MSALDTESPLEEADRVLREIKDLVEAVEVQASTIDQDLAREHDEALMEIWRTLDQLAWL
ncbi:MAG: hypothetical protein CMO55_12225 [Verrucomicrobiales bacterium]|nr:hypothetical protein [Verrucomicrobiales bacterium]